MKSMIAAVVAFMLFRLSAMRKWRLMPCMGPWTAYGTGGSALIMKGSNGARYTLHAAKKTALVRV